MANTKLSNTNILHQALKSIIPDINIPKPDHRVLKYRAGHKVKVAYHEVPAVIMLTGKFGAGKTHVADILTAYGYVRMAFGNIVRESLYRDITDIQSALFTEPNLDRAEVVRWFYRSLTRKLKLIHGQDFQLDIAFIQHMVTLAWISAPAVHRTIYSKPTPPEIRFLLQYYGTDMYRTVDEYHWVKRAMAQYKALGTPPLVVIDDLRFPSELAFAKWLSVEPFLIRVDGDESDEYGRGHSSEASIDGIKTHLVLDNRSSNRVKNREIESAIIVGHKLVPNSMARVTTSLLPIHRHYVNK